MNKTSGDYWKESERLVAEDRVVDALAVVEQGLRRFPEDLDLLTAQGMTLLLLPDPQPAYDAFRVLEPRRPDNQDVMVGRIGSSLLVGRVREARVLLNRFLMLPDTFAPYFESLGQTAARVREFTMARCCFAEAVRREPGSKVGLRGLAASLLELGRDRAAWAILGKLNAPKRP